MKKHIYSISIVLSIAYLYYFSITIVLFFTLVMGVISYDASITDSIKNEYFPNALSIPQTWWSLLFVLFAISLNVFLILRLKLASKILKNYKASNFIAPHLAIQLNKIGNGFDYYSFLWYALNLIFGVLVFNDMSSFYRTLPYALTFYLLGKIILIMGTIAAEGEILKSENDLTV